MLVDKIHNISCGDKYDKFYFLSLFDSTRVHLWLETVPTNLMLTKLWWIVSDHDHWQVKQDDTRFDQFFIQVVISKILVKLWNEF